MRKAFVGLLTLGLGAWLASCSGSEKKDGAQQGGEGKQPTMTLLDSASFNFGEIEEGQVVEHTFKFKNEGVYPLIINNISSSCGCTTPEWPRDPVNAGETSNIRVRFDSKHKAGPQVKTITVYANTEPSESELRLTGVVKAIAKADSAK